MRQIATILLLILSSVTFADGKAVVMPPDRQEIMLMPCSIEDKGRADIVAIADMLHDCRLQLPQSARLHTQRPDEQTSHRRPSYSSRATDAVMANPLQQIHPHYSTFSRQALAAARHDRGYYVYTLRHIII
ncbi:MAG: hypothetical protein IKJ97_04085 [Bacteroidaceae bacterium]|nr:hypothetical protein [Bacteroidaceae bacterium]